MKLFIRAALSGSLLFTLLCVGVMLIGESNSTQPELFKYLSLCDGQPCYLNIVPGKTSWDDTLSTFEDKAGLAFDPDTNIASQPSGFRGSMLIFASEQYEFVAEIDLEMRLPDVNVGVLVQQFGIPCAVVVTPVAQIGLIYPGMSVIIQADQLGMDQALQPNTLIRQINLFNRFQTCDQVSGIQFLSWRGFVHYTN